MGLNNCNEGDLYLWVKVFDYVKVKELVLVLVTDQSVQSPDQRGCRVGLVKVFGWTERNRR